MAPILPSHIHMYTYITWLCDPYPPAHPYPPSSPLRHITCTSIHLIYMWCVLSGCVDMPSSPLLLLLSSTLLHQ